MMTGSAEAWTRDVVMAEITIVCAPIFTPCRPDRAAVVRDRTPVAASLRQQ